MQTKAFHIPRTLLLTLIFLAGFVVVDFQQAYGQCTVNPRIRKIDANVTPRIQTFMEYLPAGYNANPTASYPLLIYWAGVGEIFGGPGGGTQALCTILSNSIPMFINQGLFPDVVLDNTNQPYSYIVIAPMMTNTLNMNNVFEASAMIDFLKLQYRVDPNRVYMAGISFGSYLLMDFTSSTQANAQKVAAIVPAANCFPSGAPDFNQRVANLANGNVSIWGIQCSADEVCSPTSIQNWVNSVNALKPGNAKYTPVACVPPTDHAVWNLAYHPTFEENGRNVYEWLILSAQGTIVPVTLKDYTARLQSNKVIVEWATTNESNSRKFVLERAGANQDFKAIAETAAAGSSSVDKKYSIVDEQPEPGINLYRLSLVNLDGKKEYFQIKRLNNPKGLSGKINIPNPAKGTLDIYINLDKKERIQIQVFDLNGRLLKEVKKEFNSGLSENKIDVSSLSHGTYLIRVTGETVSVNKKIIVN